jgi:large subunit ribosomal protein L30
MTTMKLKITQTRSTIKRPQPQKKVMQALGLRRMHQTVEHDDTPTVRGMIAKVQHLVQIEEA